SSTAIPRWKRNYERPNAVTTDHTLEERLETLLESTEGIRQNIAAENIKRDKRIRVNQRATIAAIIAALLGVTVGVVGIHRIRQAAEATLDLALLERLGMLADSWIFIAQILIDRE